MTADIDSGYPPVDDWPNRAWRVGEIPGLDVGQASAWLEANVDGATGPFEFDLIAGGHSNLTFAVTASDDARFVLRRPPLGHMLASAHDMGREHRILAGLQDTAVPVPQVEGFCADPAVIGAPFYVMRYVVGHVIRDADAARSILTPEAPANASRSLVDTMAKIHAVDLVAAGLDDLGRHEGYIARQLRRWYGNISEQRTRDLPAIDRIHDALAARIPDQVGASLVHGDYRLDNCMVDDDGELVAVLDWEICTLGDPLADVGLLTVYWTGPGRSARRLDRRCDHRTRLLAAVTHRRAVRRGVGPRRVEPRLLRRVRVLEAGVHPRRRVREVPRRRARRPRSC